MQILWVLGLVILLGSATIGLTLVVAGRDLGADKAASGVATMVDDGLQRTRTAVDVLIQPELEAADVRATTTASHRGEVYMVVGTGLLGVSVVAALGLLLLGG